MLGWLGLRGLTISSVRTRRQSPLPRIDWTRRARSRRLLSRKERVILRNSIWRFML